jgi:3,2-trans-enoyl-CoA isomerase
LISAVICKTLFLPAVLLPRQEADMSFVTVQEQEGVAVLTLTRGKVNALNGLVVDELRSRLKDMESNDEIRSIILTGAGKFFSFGFDIPEFLSFDRERFTSYLSNFTNLYTYLFLFPKPVVAALNGHAIAGGCMLALACDCRIMVSGKAKMSLNEITFGASVFAGATEMLRFLLGGAKATDVLYSGAMYSAEEARALGLVQEVVAEADIVTAARRAALDMASRPGAAFTSIKLLLRKAIAEEMMRREADSIREFVEIWYSKPTWANLQRITIR